MVIIFYDAGEDKIYICTETDKTKVVSLNDPNIMDYIPNDDVLYVENAHFITKQQFGDWLSGGLEINSAQGNEEVSRFQGFLDPGPKMQKVPFTQHEESHVSSAPKKFYIHPKHNGTIIIGDISTAKYPKGIAMNGKWHFIAVDDIGEDVLEESQNFKWALAKGKIEVVDSEYVKQNMHKQKNKVSPSEAALNAILVPANMKAEAAAGQGGVHGTAGLDIPEIFVEG